MKKGRTWNGMSRQPAPRNVSDRLSAAPKQSGRDWSNDSKLEPSKSLSRSSRHCTLRMTSVFVRIEVVDCFIQKPSSIVTSVFFITNRPLYAQIILDECIALISPVEIKAPRPITLEFQAPFNMPLLNAQLLKRYRRMLVKVIYERDVFVYVSKL